MSRLKNEKIIKRLTDQMSLEAGAAFRYLGLSAWSEEQGLIHTANFFKEQYREELEHMEKVFNYLLDSGNRPQIKPFDIKVSDFKNLQEVFEYGLKSEREVTDHVHKSMEEAQKLNDFQTVEFLRWYVTEQQEEEQLFNTVLDRLKLIDIDHNNGLHLADEFIHNVRQYIE